MVKVRDKFESDCLVIIAIIISRSLGHPVLDYPTTFNSRGIYLQVIELSTWVVSAIVQTFTPIIVSLMKFQTVY